METVGMHLGDSRARERIRGRSCECGPARLILINNQKQMRLWSDNYLSPFARSHSSLRLLPLGSRIFLPRVHAIPFFFLHFPLLGVVLIKEHSRQIFRDSRFVIHGPLVAAPFREIATPQRPRSTHFIYFANAIPYFREEREGCAIVRNADDYLLRFTRLFTRPRCTIKYRFFDLSCERPKFIDVAKRNFLEITIFFVCNVDDFELQQIDCSSREVTTNAISRLNYEATSFGKTPH